MAAVLVLALLGGLGIDLRSGVAAPAAATLETWIDEAGLPPAIRRALAARLQTDPTAGDWLIAREGTIYSLSYVAVAGDKPAQVRQGRRAMAELRARQGLLLYAAGEYFERAGFSQREAIATALATLDNQADGRLLAGLQSRVGVLDTGVVALAWMAQEGIVAYRQRPPSRERFLPAYCEAVYPTALSLQREGRHADALTLYKEMHALQCRQPLAYFLDAADCFIALAQPRDAQRMAVYLWSEFGAKLDRVQAERAGDLLFQVGDEVSAEQAYRQALKLTLGTSAGAGCPSSAQ